MENKNNKFIMKYIFILYYPVDVLDVNIFLFKFYQT